MRYPGAVVLAARAAARSGAGVVTIASARSVVEAIAGNDPNLTFFPLAEAQPGIVATASAAQITTALGEKVKALLVGPGLSHAVGTDEFVAAILRNARGTPTVVDADGLNALARTEDWTRPRDWPAGWFPPGADGSRSPSATRASGARSSRSRVPRP